MPLHVRLALIPVIFSYPRGGLVVSMDGRKTVEAKVSAKKKKEKNEALGRKEATRMDNSTELHPSH